eukprot:Blabericola_migrator_1__4757@NODE_2502_length_2668_cov_13_771626_g1566_i1_p2_GENE_NODE_2502_length_2668_cov_13_771626_g1566_i1NODE_2502_length_2668_cov_13_771626_g1566_i1_p2_ORF_typecomplete_len171_score21_54RNA_pol_inhib/PF16857_5/0_1DUF4443/PF14544_6/1_4DUF4443/PF14544_6/5_5e02_NODE_2502_length_2668_cov_13_771626_g1566_i120722584
MRISQGNIQGRIKEGWIPKEGDLVLVSVSEKPTGGSPGIHKNNKLRLNFSMPKVITKVSDSKLKLIVKELWSPKEEEVSYHRVVPLEVPLFAEELEEAGLEIVTDLQRSDMPKSRFSQTPLHRIPADDLPVVKRRLQNLQEVIQQVKKRRFTSEFDIASGETIKEESVGL